MSKEEGELHLSCLVWYLSSTGSVEYSGKLHGRVHGRDQTTTRDPLRRQRSAAAHTRVDRSPLHPTGTHGDMSVTAATGDQTTGQSAGTEKTSRQVNMSPASQPASQHPTHALPRTRLTTDSRLAVSSPPLRSSVHTSPRERESWTPGGVFYSAKWPGPVVFAASCEASAP